MTSIGSFSKQIPLNAGFYAFRAPGVASGPTHVSSAMFTTNTTGAMTAWAVPTGFDATVAAKLSSVLYKDMGTTYLSGGRTFRRVQAVFPTLNSTNGIAGVTSPAGVDSDFLCAYIEVGINGFAKDTAGNNIYSPWVRTG
jgi:hypothetical protein